MGNHRRFKMQTLDQLRAELAELRLDIPIATDGIDVLGEPVQLGHLSAPNRFVVNPMEGFDSGPDGAPQQLSFRRYRRYAAGGAGLLWFEATAVLQEARSNPGQLCLHAGNVGAFADLVAETRKSARETCGHDPILILQMTHSGRYSKPTGVPEPIIAQHNPILDPLHNLPPDYPLVSDEYLDELQEVFLRAAGLAAEAGFDGVDVKSCHRYLVAELHGSFERTGRYGGSLENRTRVLRESIEKIARTYPDLLLTTRMNVYDAMQYPYGFGVSRDDWTIPDLSEPLQLISWLRDLGISLLNVSMGNPYFNPHYNRPYDFPIHGFLPPDEHPLAGVARLLHATREIQQVNPDLPVVGSGYAWMRQFMPNVAAAAVQHGWASLIGQGRGAFAYPDSVRDILNTGGMDPAKCCVTCSACTQIMRDGGRTGCVVRDSAIYGPQYRLARRFAPDRLLEEAKRCRDCEQATCVRGCPAHVDVPAFIKAFVDGNIETAYRVLKAGNVLPEMCGSICPACEQCEGQCLENIFCERPVAIQDIQLFVARTARLKGLTGVRLPTPASGKRVAVLGGGPASLACTIGLLEAGHSVTLLEKGSTLGGTPDTTIPEERFGSAEAEIESILKPAKESGRLDIRFQSPLGADTDLAGLRSAYDAVFIGIGLTESTSLGQANGVCDALSFLKSAKAGAFEGKPKQVAVLGGGNTAMDAGATALRLGAADVYLVYRRSFSEMPAWRDERDAFLNAGGHVLLLSQPLGYETDDNGTVCGLRIARTALGEPDDSGRRRPVLVPDSEYVLPVDLVIEAIGQTLADDVRQALAELEFTSNGLVLVRNGTCATSADAVFAGGDIVNGGTTAVQGIAEGMRAAAEIDACLRG